MTDVNTTSVKKIQSKVMIYNVAKEESEKELIKTLIEWNDYLQEIGGIEGRFTTLFNRKAAGGTFHYILKCDPTVRDKHNVKVNINTYTQ